MPFKFDLAVAHFHRNQWRYFAGIYILFRQNEKQDPPADIVGQAYMTCKINKIIRNRVHPDNQKYLVLPKHKTAMT